MNSVYRPFEQAPKLFVSLLVSLAASEVQKFGQIRDNSLSRSWGEGGRRPGEGSADDGDAALGVRGRSLGLAIHQPATGHNSFA